MSKKVKQLCFMAVAMLLFNIPLSGSSANKEATLEISVVQTDENPLKTILSINVTNVTPKTFFNKLKLETKGKVSFIYVAEDFSDVKPITLNMKNVTVEELLNKLLLPYKNLSYQVKDNVVTIVKKVVPQTVTKVDVRGRILNAKTKKPVASASVIVLGSTIGTMANENGNFFLTAASNDVLEISCVGMKTVIYNQPLTDKDITILMDVEAIEVNDIVITGYQKIDKRQLTSAVTTLKAKDLIRPGIMSIDQVLEGQVPDMVMMSNSGEVGVVPKIRIRGTSTLIGNREPLWVLNGVVLHDPVPVSPDELNDPDFINRVGNAIAGINPQDIDRIDVLKDASATALYGTKAANGVIVITTKKGAVGAPVVSYSLSTSFKQRPRYTDNKIDLMNSQERINFSKDLIANHHKYPSDINMVGYEGLITQLYNKQITSDEFTRGVHRLEAMNTDWFDVLMQDVFSHQHTISISGGSEKLRAYASVGYGIDNDVIKGADNERYTATLNLDATLTKKLTVSVGVMGDIGSREYSQSSIGPVDYAYNTSRAIQAYNDDNSYSFYDRRDINQKYNYNILNEMDNSYTKQKTDNISFSANAIYKFTDYLNLNALFGYSTSNADIEGYWGDKTYYAATLRKTNYGIPAEKGVDSKTELPFGGELTKDHNRNESYTARVQLDFNKYLDPNYVHNINASIGFEASSTKYKGSSSMNRGFFADRGKQFATGVPLDDYPQYKKWMEGNYPTISDNLSNVISAYATASYSYKNYFTINANTRMDGSNKFGSRSNEKLLPVWSVSGLYNISEHFNIKNNILNYLTLKVSYGYQGNMLDDQSPTMIIRKLPVDPFYNEPSSVVDIYPNPDLRWEKTGSFNTGLEFSLFNNALQVETSFYYKKTKDAFMNKTISTINGRRDYIINSGVIENKGFSIGLSTTPIRTQDFRWSLSTSFSKSYNKMNSLPGSEQYDLMDFLEGTALVKGQPINSFYSYKFLGLNPNDGGPVFDDMQERNEELKGLSKYETYIRVLERSGSREPSISGSLNSSFRYKSFNLGFSLIYSFGAKTRLFKLYEDGVNFRPEKNVNREFMNRWKKPGDEMNTNIPAIVDGNSPAYNKYAFHWSAQMDVNEVHPIANNSWDMYNYGNQRVVSADYLKCGNISLSYSVPEKALKDIFISNVYVTFSVSNPFIICSKDLKGQTPIQGGFTTIQLSERPTYSLGVNISF